jgi:actin-related protein 9
MTAFRDSTVVIIETGRTIIRAGLGLHDLLKTPALVCNKPTLSFYLLDTHYHLQEIPARVGLRISDLPQANGKSKEGGEDINGCASAPVGYTPKVNDYLVGSQLDEALATDQDITVSWPFVDGDIHDWTQAEAIWYAS